MNDVVTTTRLKEDLATVMRDAGHAVHQQASHAVHATGDYAKRNPWQALGIAAGVGLMVGVLLGRR